MECSGKSERESGPDGEGIKIRLVSFCEFASDPVDGSNKGILLTERNR